MIQVLRTTKEISGLWSIGKKRRVKLVHLASEYTSINDMEWNGVVLYIFIGLCSV